MNSARLTAAPAAWHKSAVFASRFPPTLVLVFGLVVAAVTAAAEPEGPLPRFASLKADEVNVRTGPGTRYPIAWVFVRAGLPVEVIGEYQLWRRIVDVDGAQGWVHRGMLSDRRSAIVVGAARTFYRRPDADARVVLRAEPGVHGRLFGCHEGWCEMQIAGLKGWTRRDHLWGVYPAEETRE